jgi:hypothetical protein
MIGPVADIQWAAWVQAVCAVLGLVTTFVLVKISRDNLVLARQLLDAGTSPLIAVYVRLSARNTHWPELVVENIGGGTAFEITFETNWHEMERLIGPATIKMLQNGIAALASRKLLVYDLHSLEPSSNGWPDRSIPIEATFAKAPGRTERLCAESQVNLAKLTGLGLEVNSDPLRLIVREIKGLSNEMRELTRVLDGEVNRGSVGRET